MVTPDEFKAAAAAVISDRLATLSRQLDVALAERDRLMEVFTFLEDPTTRQVNFGEPAQAPPRGHVYLNAQMGVLLIAANLPALGAGQTFEMWVIPPGANAMPRPAGLFEPADDGTAVHMLNQPRLDAQQEDTFFTTLEPPIPAVSYDVDGEIWIRYDPETKNVVGFEIENFESIFLKKHPEISKMWKIVKPYCAHKKTRSSDDTCDAFIRILIEFFTNFLKENPQQIRFSPSNPV